MKPTKGEDSPTLEPPGGRMVSILLVDEDANDLRLFSSLFQQKGFAVRACDTHADALRWLESEIFDFVIVSQGSPKFEGRSVLKRANEIDRRLPVVVLARCADVGCYLEAIQLGALDYLEKPVPAPQLLRFVKRHLRART
jgi:two-component system C4-dicarboxylate transport response regulator DctD